MKFNISQFIPHSKFVGEDQSWHKQYAERQPPQKETIIFLNNKHDWRELSLTYVGTHPADMRRKHIENMGI